MEKPGKKLKKVLMIGGTTGAVYAGLKYLLPLVAPFLIGYALALLLRPSARFLSYRLGIRLGGRRWQLPVGVAGGAEFLLLLSAASAGLYMAGVKLCQEGKLFFRQLPLWVEELDRSLAAGCGFLERTLGLESGLAAGAVSRLLADLVRRLQGAAMPLLMANSLVLIRWLVMAAVVSVVVFLSVVLSLQEMDDLRWRRDRSIFRREFQLIGDRMVRTGKAWFKTQGILMLLITAICILGMFLLKNPYYIMAGVGIGVMDALPVFGTGTVLIPWILLCLFSQRWKQALGLGVLYLICYFLRQILENKLMADQVGLSPLETLAAVYVGLQLFGFFGFILGPLGLLLIEDMAAHLLDR